MIDKKVDQNIMINENNGIIEINDLNIGNYEVDILYKYKDLVLQDKIKIIINPYINYLNSVVNIKYGTFYEITEPHTSHKNGIFLCKNLPEGIKINEKSGIIIIKENTDINLYNLTIVYNINDLYTTTNIYINIHN